MFQNFIRNLFNCSIFITIFCNIQLKLMRLFVWLKKLRDDNIIHLHSIYWFSLCIINRA